MWSIVCFWLHQYFLFSSQNSPSQWAGDLSQPALTILHQHAIQGDVTVLQTHVVRWIAYAGKQPDKSFHFSVLYRILNDLDHQWSSLSSEPLSREEEDALAESFASFVKYSLSCIRKIRYLFSPRLSNSSKLEYLLKYIIGSFSDQLVILWRLFLFPCNPTCVCRCLMQLDVMRAFRRCCPFHKEIRGEIVAAVRKGAAEWFTFELQRYTTEGNCRRRLLFINMKQGNRGDAHLIFRRYCLVRALIFISTFSILLLLCA